MTRAAWLNVARVLFLAAAVGFAAWGLRGQWPEILAAAAHVSVSQLLGATVLISIGVLLTGWVWLLVMASYGYPLPKLRGGAIFFVGQLGKYIPGSVWSLGAQAQMARGLAVPARTTVAAGLVFLYLNCATALLAGCAVGLAAGSSVPSWVLGAGTVGGIALLAPAVVGRIAALLSGEEDPPLVGWRLVGQVTTILAVVWLAYGMATALLSASMSGEVAAGRLLAVAVAGFTIAYLVGVVVVLAPSGLGARELVLGLALAPVIGVPAAAAVTLLARVLHTLVDFGIAGLAWLIGRRRGTVSGETRSP